MTQEVDTKQVVDKTTKDAGMEKMVKQTADAIRRAKKK